MRLRAKQIENPLGVVSSWILKLCHQRDKTHGIIWQMEESCQVVASCGTNKNTLISTILLLYYATIHT